MNVMTIMMITDSYYLCRWCFHGVYLCVSVCLCKTWITTCKGLYNYTTSQIRSYVSIRHYECECQQLPNRSILGCISCVQQLHVKECQAISNIPVRFERIKYKLLSLTYKVLTTNQPQYLHDSTSVQLCHNTRSSSMVAHLVTYLLLFENHKSLF